jgi:putative membrane protein
MTFASIVAIAALYGFGLRRAKRYGRALRRTTVAAFVLALAIAAGASSGTIDALADGSLAWHMAQHLVLAFIVAPLLLLGAPVRLAIAVLPRAAARWLAGVLRSTASHIVGHPAVAWLQFAAVLYVVHFSPFYESALEHPAIHALEHALFLGSALAFWMPILAVAPAPHAPAHLVRLLMLFLALPMSAFLGFILYVDRRPLYAHYAAFPGALGDQANAGAVMWIAGSAPIVIALLWCVADWGARERRLGTIADRMETT